VTAKGSAEKKTEKVPKRKKKLPAVKKQATVNDDNEEICSAETCLRPAGTYVIDCRLCVWAVFFIICRKIWLINFCNRDS